MSDESPESNEGEMAPGEVDWENRVLCSDESCIGVIGPDGRCKECGKSYEGSLNDDELRTQESDETQTSAADDDDLDAAEPQQADFDDSDWENRTLCSDESCIGVIGPNGRCKECGKRYKG
jgi:hypothetical protein